MNSKINLKYGLVVALIFVAAATRLLPHPPNFTAVGAMSLFGAAYFSRKYLAFLIPFAALWLSDLLLNNLVYAQMFPEFYPNFTWFGSIWVYAGFALIALLGMPLLRRVRVPNLLLAGVSASLVFFLITNFGVWASSPMYAKTFSGLLAAYTAGIPFFWNTLLGDLFFIGILFGAYEGVLRLWPALNVGKA